ncbi:MAG TPA: PadR family transcriptional regulator [Vicinamibacteria bacterium]|nr:PadR family transcriptional regulator [Vicinamibacteria bacterium]
MTRNDGAKKPPDGEKPAGQDGGWEAQLRRGSLELAILASLWNRRLYGLEILRALESTSALGVAEGTLYLILGRLKAEGLVDAEWVDARSGHPRKYYWLSGPGRDRLRRMALIWAEFSANLDALVEPVLDRKERARAPR